MGKIGKYPIQMHLERQADAGLTGYYVYTNKGEKRIQLHGKITNTTNHSFELVEDGGEKFVGKFDALGVNATGSWNDKLEFHVASEILIAPLPQPAQVTAPTPAPAPQAPTTKPTQAPQTPTLQAPMTQPTTGSSDKWTREFGGQLDGKYNIHMHLERDGTKLNGSYYYTKQGAGKAIALTGVIDASSKAVKLEGNGETFNGAFVGAKGDKLEGKWLGGDKTLEFSVMSQKAESGTKSVISEEMKDLVPLLPESSGGFSLTTEEKALLRKHQAAGDIVWVFNLPEDNQKRDMKMSEDGISELKKYEGYGAEPYPDSSGYWTIGHGHLLDTNKNRRIEAIEWKKYDALGFSRVLDRDQADQLLRKELTKYENVVNNSVTAPLTQEMFDTLAIMSFNIPAAFGSGSGLLQAINERRYLDMPSEMYRWVYSAGNKVKGLENRRLQEITNFARPYLRKK
jgi:lysozyme